MLIKTFETRNFQKNFRLNLIRNNSREFKIDLHTVGIW